MIELRIEVQGLDRIERFLRETPELIDQALMPALRGAATRVLAAARMEIRTQGIAGATGKLSQGLTVEESRVERSATIGVRGPAEKYADAIELGRKPAGQIPGNGPPLKIGNQINRPLARWAINKAGADVDINDPRTLWPIARSIQKKGWAAKPFMAPAFAKTQEKAAAVVEAAVDRILRRAS